MPVYLYAVVRAGARPLEGVPLVEPSVGDLRVVEAGDVGALVGSFRAPRVAMTSRNVRAHEEVVEASAERDGLLPVQFGVLFESEEALVEAFLVPQAAELLRMLDALDGRVEVRATVSYVGDVALREMLDADPRLRRLTRRVRGKSPAAAYYDRIALGEMVMHQFAAVQEHDLELLAKRVGPFTEGQRLLDQGVGSSARLAFLVERTRLGAFEEELEAFARDERDRLSIEAVGPLVPWDFTDLVPNPVDPPAAALANPGGGRAWGS